MAEIGGGSNRRLPVEPDVAAVIGGLVVAALLFPLRFLSEQVFIQVVPPLLGVACLLYLVARYRDADNAVAFDRRRLSVDGAVIGGFTFLGTGVLAIVGATTGGRTIPFFAVAAAVGSGILAQIIFLDEDELRPAAVLAQLLLFAVVVRFTALLTTPGLVGVDSWTHLTDYAASIQSADSLSAIADVKYRTAPLFHVLVVVFADALGVGLREATYASLGLVMPLAALFVYGAASLFIDQRWALLGAAIFAMSDHVIRWGIHLIPTSMGLVFFLGALAMTTRYVYADSRPVTAALIATFSIATALTHQVSAFILLVVLAAGSLVQLVGPTLSESNERTGALWPLFGLHAVVVTVLWSITPYRSGAFLGEVVQTVETALVTTVGFLNLASSGEGGGARAAGGEIPVEIALLDALGFFVLLFAVVVGSLAVLRRNNASPATTISVAAVLVMGIFTFGLPLFGFRTFLPGRWYAFLYAPMAIVAAAGCQFAVRRLSPRTAMAGLLLFALVVPGAMMINHKGTPDNPVFDQEYVTYAYDESELAAVETVGATRPDGADPIYTDHPYRTVFERSGAASANMLAVEDGRIIHDTTVYRNYQSSGTPVVLVDGVGAKRQVSQTAVCRPSAHKLYANGDVAVCTGIDGIDGA